MVVGGEDGWLVETGEIESKWMDYYMLEKTRLEPEPFLSSGPVGWCVVVLFSTRSGPFHCCYVVGCPWC